MGRVDPIPVREWPKGMREAMAAYRTPNPRHPFPADDPDRPKGLNALGLLAHHPALTTAYHHLVGHCLFGTTLTVRQRELAILRVAHRRDARYEWAQHVYLAGEADISAEEIERVRAGGDATGWDPAEAALLRAVDDLLDEARIREPTAAALADVLDTQQMMDFVVTVGTYDTLAMILRTFDVPVDKDLAPYAGTE